MILWVIFETLVLKNWHLRFWMYRSIKIDKHIDKPQLIFQLQLSTIKVENQMDENLRIWLQNNNKVVWTELFFSLKKRKHSFWYIKLQIYPIVHKWSVCIDFCFQMIKIQPTVFLNSVNGPETWRKYSDRKGHDIRGTFLRFILWLEQNIKGPGWRAVTWKQIKELRVYLFLCLLKTTFFLM